MLDMARCYVTMHLKNRWLLIPMWAVIFMVRIHRFGYVRVEIQLAITLLILAILWPKTKYEHWESPARQDLKHRETTTPQTTIDLC